MSKLCGSSSRATNSNEKRIIAPRFRRLCGAVAAAFTASKAVRAAAAGHPSADQGCAHRLGLASYTFRNFSRAQMIGFMKQLNAFEWM